MGKKKNLSDTLAKLKIEEEDAAFFPLKKSELKGKKKKKKKMLQNKRKELKERLRSKTGRGDPYTERKRFLAKKKLAKKKKGKSKRQGGKKKNFRSTSNKVAKLRKAWKKADAYKKKKKNKNKKNKEVKKKKKKKKEEDEVLLG